ncbi:MAG: hypothetical protein OXJ90_12795 [Spirochaetaceae bacterium]|nr:hypothetical protein [Spirochaetaceae bacterium]
MSGDIPSFQEIAYTNSAHRTAKENALMTTPPTVPGTMAKPNTMATLAPNAAADDTPIVNGLTSGLRVSACITTPETESAAPARTARTTRGSRRRSTIFCSTVMLASRRTSFRRASAVSPSEMSAMPICNETSDTNASTPTPPVRARRLTTRFHS